MNNQFLGSLPLPASSSAETLETVSRTKLCLLFDPALFEIRPELQRDKGIDLIVELKQDGCYTNFRFVIQLKATASVTPDKHGSPILSYRDQQYQLPAELWYASLLYFI